MSELRFYRLSDCRPKGDRLTVLIYSSNLVNQDQDLCVAISSILKNGDYWIGQASSFIFTTKVESDKNRYWIYVDDLLIDCPGIALANDTTVCFYEELTDQEIKAKKLLNFVCRSEQDGFLSAYGIPKNRHQVILNKR